MNLLDFFKKREQRKKISAPVKSAAAPKEAVAEILPEKKLGSSKRAPIILRSPKITEKSSLFASESGVYVFRVAQGASKHEIKKAVEELYGVKVEQTRVINMPARLRSFGRKSGFRPGYRKALVKLAKGQKIEYI
ncbi:MAG: 50S ribosomal protein L23 [Candidatus Niyogibacteria bacterium]|nr:50S ribosomal protein L23 [Candidatus Niyogibacteria bacterium]